MTDPRNYPDLMMADDEQEREDAPAGHVPAELFGAEVARRMNENPELRAWAEAWVIVTDLDGECPTCHGRGCWDCLNEDGGEA